RDRNVTGVQTCALRILNSLVTRAGNGRIAVIVLWENSPGEDLVEGYMRQVRDFFGREQIVLKRMERAVAKQENENIRSLYEEIRSEERRVGKEIGKRSR